MNSTPNKTLIDGLKALCSENDVAQKLFAGFAGRAKDARETTVVRAAWLAGADYYAMLAVFRELDQLGAGRFIPGRHGYQSRMEWAFSIRSLGQVAQGQKAKPEEVAADAIVEDETDEAGPGSGVKSLRHEFQLREGFRARFDLPSDMTDKEAERLAAFIKTLPF